MPIETQYLKRASGVKGGVICEEKVHISLFSNFMSTGYPQPMTLGNSGNFSRSDYQHGKPLRFGGLLVAYHERRQARIWKKCLVSAQKLHDSVYG